MIRFIQVALYLAIMFAIAWVLGKVVPGFVEWADDTFGKHIVGASMLVIPALLYSLAYYLNRRDSGRA